MLRPFREAEAVTTASWAYAPPFDVYNGDPSNFPDYLAVDEHGYGFYAVIDNEGQPVGFCCFGDEARVSGQEAVEGIVDLGGGLRPDLLSQGIATEVFPVIIEFARMKFAPTYLRTAVASFNKRSTQLCLSAGFTITRTFAGPGGEFQELERPAESK